MFKATIHGTVEYVTNIEGDLQRLSLAGVGTFEILKTKPRGTKAGYVEKVIVDAEGKPVLDEAGKETKEQVKDETLKVWPFVPRFRFYPSSNIDNLIESKFDLGDHDLKEVKHYGLYAPAEEVVEAAPEAKAPKADKKAEKKTAPRAEAKAAPKADKAKVAEATPEAPVESPVEAPAEEEIL